MNTANLLVADAARRAYDQAIASAQAIFDSAYDAAESNCDCAAMDAARAVYHEAIAPARAVYADAVNGLSDE